MAKKPMGVRQKAERRVKQAMNRLSKNGYVFNKGFVEKVQNKKTHFEKIDIDKIYANATKGGVKGTKARAQERSERARRAARTRKERQQQKYQIPDSITALRSVLEELNSSQLLAEKGSRYPMTFDVSGERDSLLSFYDGIVSDKVQSGEGSNYADYLRNVESAIMGAVNNANNAYYWEELQEAYSNIMSLLKGGSLTMEEAKIGESLSQDVSSQYYETEMGVIPRFLSPYTTVTDSQGNKVNLLRNESVDDIMVFRADTLSYVEYLPDEDIFVDEETGEILT